ncbi:T. brucei spp.-specific protein [Trypanosoma brucei gambiense DAL972]|uniref:T. brucei spp.-specific protein n=2 Tax=Trypanosoma brucei TaxID=5691 RepID=D0A1R7_TRYB9|nr:T. brucei spp.-specific protein [Trypanosoma brucei gambiense DAL972]RHW69085.1 hypothetical protein DPX39_100029900 [Trypanosoma brucei equiperdum]CBH15210.1 T. brucei spp.-specific protein [Trypanosoma brucei gambiense DAL972]|eukprot:XP_011777475.1 T. brucei spp.-specific protein [Trypanosoma brucei gambiense DAL972]
MTISTPVGIFEYKFLLFLPNFHLWVPELCFTAVVLHSNATNVHIKMRMCVRKGCTRNKKKTGGTGESYIVTLLFFKLRIVHLLLFIPPLQFFFFALEDGGCYHRDWLRLVPLDILSYSSSGEVRTTMCSTFSPTFPPSIGFWRFLMFVRTPSRKTRSLANAAEPLHPLLWIPSVAQPFLG